MKPTYLLLAAAAALAISGCNGDSSGNGNSSSGGETAQAQQVEPPADGDWSKVVTQTPQGAFVMGNPNAEVRLIEFGSMTCPHCAEFDETGVPKLVEQYVKPGKVAYEYRNYVRDPYDITASLIARCNGAERFFPLTRALFENQQGWMGKVQAASEQQLQQVANLGPEQQFVQIAQLADLQQWAAQRGVPTAKSSQCLTNQEEVNRLVQMNADATNEYPNLPGTPSFVINGTLVENAASWEALEPKLREAVGS